MSTPTPTSDALSGLHALPLPDPTELARLATAFFTAVPGADGAALAGPSSGAPSAAGADTIAQSFPHAWPDAAQTGTAPPRLSATGAAPPASPPAAVPAQPPLGVPPSYAAALPHIDAPVPRVPAEPPAPSTPYYFLGEASGYPSAAHVPLDATPPPDDRIATQAFALPGAADLQTLLSGLDPAIPATSPPARTTQPFYFLTERNDANGIVVPATPAAAAPFDVAAIRRDFPILSERVNGRQLVWFDNAATTQKPQAVIDRLTWFYQHENSNIHRAAHELAARATDAYEAARHKVARFLGASSDEEIIFVRGATEAINLVAQTWGRANLQPGDEIIVSHLEHHANIVPWQQIAAEKGALIRVIPVDDKGELLLGEYQKLLNERTRLVAVTQVSNALGTVTPVHEIVRAAHAAGALALVDGAQSVSHLRVNLQALDADFFVFSGHKIFGPTGIGVVYGKRAVLETLPPWQGGGNMIADVTFEHTQYREPPTRFEAGTGNIGDAVGLGAALDYVERIGLERIARYEHDLLAYATHAVSGIPGLRIIGTAREKASVLSFVIAGLEPETIGRALNQDGIAVRAGHHCAQPILRRFGLEATVRASLAFYNTCEEVDAFAAVLRRLSQRNRPV